MHVAPERGSAGYAGKFPRAVDGAGKGGRHEAGKKPAKSPRWRRWTRILSVAAALVFVVGGTLLTKDSLSPARTSAPQSLADSYDYDYDTYTSDVGYSEEAGSGVRTMMVGTANDAMPEAASAKSAVAEDKKIIRNVSLSSRFSAHMQRRSRQRQQEIQPRRRAGRRNRN